MTGFLVMEWQVCRFFADISDDLYVRDLEILSSDINFDSGKYFLKDFVIRYFNSISGDFVDIKMCFVVILKNRLKKSSRKTSTWSRSLRKWTTRTLVKFKDFL